MIGGDDGRHVCVECVGPTNFLGAETATIPSAYMSSKAKPPAVIRVGEPLQIGREWVSYARNRVAQTGSTFTLQHRLFVNDPWAIIAEAIHRAVPEGRTRDIAHSFRRQAEDYFRTATIGREMAVRPVLLYYAFLNLSKAYAVAKGNTGLAGRTGHGVSLPPNKPRQIQGALIKFERPGPTRPGVFQELLKLLDASPAVLASDLKLGQLLPQILPGHRLWCYAADRQERFIPVERFEARHASRLKQVWLNLYVDRDDLDRLGISETKVMAEGNLASEFEIADDPSCLDSVCFQQRNPESYSADAAEALFRVVRRVRNNIWETVKVASPYRKAYIYCSPISERKVRLPQMLSVYLLMFFLGSVTRYTPLYFEDLLESPYGPLLETFISESPMQFLYLMASEILDREISKPAIIRALPKQRWPRNSPPFEVPPRAFRPHCTPLGICPDRYPKTAESDHSLRFSIASPRSIHETAEVPQPLPQRQPPDADAFAIRRDRGAFGKGALALNVHRADQIGLALRVEALDAQQHHRRAPLSGHRQMRVEIVVQRYTDAFVQPGLFEDLDVLGPLHSDFGDMRRVQPTLPKNRRRMRGEPLIQQNALHATRPVLNRSSSTVAAAYRSACWRSSGSRNGYSANSAAWSG